MSEPNPLAEAQIDSLEELFSRDPLSLTDNDVDRITKALRAQRAKWVIQDAAPKAPRAKKTASKPVNVDISFDDLGIV